MKPQSPPPSHIVLNDRTTRDRLAMYDRRRRLGVYMFYAPAFFLILFVAVAFSFAPASVGRRGAPSFATWQTGILAIPFFGCAIAILSLPFSLLLMFVYGYKVRFPFPRGTHAELSPSPSLEENEVLGNWVVQSATPDRLVLHTGDLRAGIRWLLLWGTTVFFVFMASASIAPPAYARPSTVSARIIACVIMLAIGVFVVYVLCRVIPNRRIEAISRPDGSGLDLTLTSRPHPWLRTVRKSWSPVGPFSMVMTKNNLTLQPEGQPPIRVDGFGSGVLGQWQMFRFAIEIAARRTSESSIDSAVYDDDYTPDGDES